MGPTSSRHLMDSATFSGILVVVFGLLATWTFVLGAARAVDLPRGTRILWLMTAAVSLYCAVLWGGLLLGQWTIPPQWGRPALALTLATIAWGGLFHSMRNGTGGRGH